MSDTGQINKQMSRDEIISALGVEKMNAEEVVRLSEEASKDSLTVNMQFYHQPYGQDPMEFQNVFSKPLRTRGEPVRRRMRIQSKIVDVDPGWSEKEDLGYLYIKHLVPHFTTKVSPEQMKEVEDSRIGVLRNGEVISELYPMDFLFLPVKDVTQFQIEVLQGAPFAAPLVEYVLLPR